MLSSFAKQRTVYCDLNRIYRLENHGCPSLKVTESRYVHQAYTAVANTWENNIEEDLFGLRISEVPTYGHLALLIWGLRSGHVVSQVDHLIVGRCGEHHVKEVQGWGKLFQGPASINQAPLANNGVGSH